MARVKDRAKRLKRLERRQASYDKVKTNHKDGWHKPGSLSK